MRALWTEERLLASWMEVECAVVEAQAELGMIPAEAAGTISARLDLATLPPSAVLERKRVVGHPMVAFLKAFREACGPAAEHLHVGPTTQDVIDTGLTLQIRAAHRLIVREMLHLEDVLCARALAHRDDVMMGRSHQQHAVPVTLGFVLACWAAEVRDHVERAKDSEPRWLLGTLSAAVGTQASFVELAGGAAARELERRVCARLGLGVPLANLHARTDRFAEVVSNLALLSGSLARMNLDIRALQRPEVMEIAVPDVPGLHWSSTMPNKLNPEPGERVDGLAKLLRGLAGAMQAVQVADDRDATRLPVELVSIPLAFLLASRTLQTTADVIAGLEPHLQRMRANLDLEAGLGLAAAERIMIAAYRKTGEKDRAHELLYECSRVARATSRHLTAVVREHPELGRLFTAEELAALCDLGTYVGTAPARVDEIVADLGRRRQHDLERYTAAAGAHAARGDRAA